MILRKQNYRILFVVLTLLGFGSALLAADRYSVANGNWNSSASWSATSGGASGAAIPIVGDIVYIEGGFDITVSGTQACDSIIVLGNFGGGGSSQLIVDGGSLTVGGGMSVSGDGGATIFNRDCEFIVDNSGTATINGNVSMLSDERTGNIDVLNSGELTINGDVSLTSARSGRSTELQVDDATLNVSGDVIYPGALRDDDIILRLRGDAVFNFGGNFDRTATGNYGELRCDESTVVNFNGSSAQTMSMVFYANTNRWQYGEVRLNNAAGVTLDADVTQTGDNEVRDDIRVQSGTFNSGGFSVLLDNGKEFEVADGAKYSTTTTDATGGIPTFTGTAGIYNFDDHSTVVFAAIGDQTIPGITALDADDYGNISINGSGTKILGQPLNDVYDGGSGNIDLAGDLIISTGIFDVSANNYYVELAGNWINSASFEQRSGTVIFNGSSVQLLSLAISDQFYDVVINNASSGLIGTGDLKVSNSLTMTQGNIYMGNSKLVLGTSTANVGTLNYTSGNVIGQFERWINSTGSAIDFPVGTAANNNLFSIDFTILTSGSLITEFIASDPGDTGLPLNESGIIIGSSHPEGYWSVAAANSLASTNYDIELTGSSFISYPINPETRILKRLSGGSPWTLDGSHVAAVAPITYRDGLSGISTANFGLGILCPVPTSIISGDSSVCIGATGMAYSVSNELGYTYNWTIIGGTQASGANTNSITIDWGAAGAGAVSVIATRPCGSAAPVNLPVNIGTGILSSTVSNSNTEIVIAGTRSAEILQIQLDVGASCGALTDFNLITTGTPGSSDPANDIFNATVYYTGTSSTFAATDTFGNLGGIPNGAFTISGSQVLPVSSTVYFWLAYDINGGATEANLADAQLSSIDIAGTNYAGMTVSDPAGSRPIHIPVTRFSVANGSWNTTASWSGVSGGSPGASIPIIGDIVFVERGYDITVSGTQACDTIIVLGSFGGGGSSRLIVDGGSLTVGGGMSVSGDGGATTFNRDGEFFVQNSGTATINGNVSMLSDERIGNIDVLTSGELTINGDVSLTSALSGRSTELQVDDATLNVNGDVIYLGALRDDNIILRLRGDAVFNFGGNFDRTATGNYGELRCDESTVVNFNGTSAQTMSMVFYANTNRWQYGEVRINNAAGVTLDADVTQTGDNEVRDDIRIQSGTFNSGGFSVLLDNGKEFEVLDSAVYYTTTTDAMGGIPTFDGTGSYNFEDRSTVIFAASADQIVPEISADDYGNVTLTESGVKTFTASGSLDIAGILSLEGTSTTAGITPTYGANASLQYKGSVAQTTGVEFPATFYGSGGVIIDNLNGVSMDNARSIDNRLTFINGLIVTDTHTLSLGSGGVVTGAGAGTYVLGNFEKGISTATASMTFEIGDASGYTPVVLDFTGTSFGTGAIIAFTTPGDHPQIASAVFSPDYTVNRYWTLSNNGVAGITSFDATFTFLTGDMDPGTNANAFVVGNYNPSTWTYPSTGVRTSNSTQALGLGILGDFQIATFSGAYRSATSGDWEQAASWEVFVGGGWSAAPAAPSAASNSITILNTHAISITTFILVDNLIINSGAALILGSDVSVSNGSGIDFTVNGTLDCGGPYALSGPGSFSLNSGATIILGSPGGISSSSATGNIQTFSRTFDNGANYTYNGSTAQITGDGLPTSIRNLSINNSSGLTLTASVTINGILALTNGALIAGPTTLTFQNSDTPIVRTSGTISCSPSTDLIFGTTGNTGGASFVIPDGTFTSAPVIHNLTVNRINDLTLNNQNLSVAGILLANGPLQSAGNLTLLSDASGTALIDGSGSASVSGDVTMQRYLPVGFGYKYFSSPFQDATVNEFGDDMDLNYWFSTVYKYDESNSSSGWEAYTDPSEPLLPMNGYSVNFGSVVAPNTVDLKGEVNNGPLSLTLYNNNNTYTQGLNLVGNPYPSAIDWDAASGWTKTNIDNAIYYFNASAVDQYSGTYSAYVNGVSSDGVASNVIPSMQGFFVHVSDGAYPVTGILAMDNSVRITDKTQYFAKSAPSRAAGSVPLIRLNLLFTDDSASLDPFVIYLDDEATAGFDSHQDARKLLNPDYSVPNLYALLPGGEKLSIDALPPFSERNIVIPLGVKANRQGTLVFRLKDIDSYFSQFDLFFFDGLSYDRLPLTDDFEYEVLLDAGEYHNRFYIEMEEIVSDVFKPGVTEEIFSAYSSYGILKARIFDISGSKGLLSLYSIDGRLIFREEIKAPGDYEFEAPQIQGIYIVNYISGRLGSSIKIVIGN